MYNRVLLGEYMLGSHRQNKDDYDVVPHVMSGYGATGTHLLQKHRECITVHTHDSQQWEYFTFAKSRSGRPGPLVSYLLLFACSVSEPAIVISDQDSASFRRQLGCHCCMLLNFFLRYLLSTPFSYIPLTLS